MRSDGDGYGGQSNSFSPSAVTITRGGTVTWSNSSGVTHDVTFAATAGAPSGIGALASGSASRTFDAAGSFDYHCSIHGAAMSGKVTVTQ